MLQVTPKIQTLGVSKQGPDAERQDPTLRYALGTVAFFLMFPVIYFVTVKPYVAGATLIEAITPCTKIVVQNGQNVCAESRETAALRSIDAFNKVFDANTFATTEAREQVVTVALQTGGNTQVSQATREKFLELAQREMQAQVTATPDDARYRLFMGMFYRAVGHLELAIPELEAAVKLTPGKQSMLGNLGSLYAENKELPKAIEILKASYALDMHNREAGRLLFAAYLQAGDRANAIATIQKMIEMEPDFKPEGEKYIADVKAGKNP